jgi:mannose-6-phosphate isomerase-like protein (cupin superfamily)
MKMLPACAAAPVKDKETVDVPVWAGVGRRMTASPTRILLNASYHNYGYKPSGIGGIFLIIVFDVRRRRAGAADHQGGENAMSFYTNIVQATKGNRNFRTVLFTGGRSQLVVMCIPPGGEVGLETHLHVEQTLFFLSGRGLATLDGKEQSIAAGDALVVTPGTAHNVVNTGDQPLEIYTVYAPPNHLEGRVHSTKAAADADVADEAFGDAVR